jgi:hypothetical protein
MIADRSGSNKPGFGCPLLSLIEMNVETFSPDKLPSGLAKIPAVKPWQQILYAIEFKSRAKRAPLLLRNQPGNHHLHTNR